MMTPLLFSFLGNPVAISATSGRATNCRADNRTCSVIRLTVPHYRPSRRLFVSGEPGCHVVTLIGRTLSLSRQLLISNQSHHGHYFTVAGRARHAPRISANAGRSRRHSRVTQV